VEKTVINTIFMALKNMVIVTEGQKSARLKEGNENRKWGCATIEGGHRTGDGKRGDNQARQDGVLQYSLHDGQDACVPGGKGGVHAEWALPPVAARDN